MSVREQQRKIELDTVVTHSEDLVSCELDGEVVLMSIANGSYFRIDEIGSRIWALLEEPRRVRDLCDQLMREFDVAREQCESDVLNFLNEMRADQLIEVV
jgi:hypothetical protein